MIDANTFKQGLSPNTQTRWQDIVNNIIAKGGDEIQAIRMANAVTRASQQRLKQRYSQAV